MARKAAADGQASKPRSRRKLDIDDYKALGAFRLAVRKFLAFSEAGAQAQGLTSPQHQALLAVRAHTGDEAMTIGELAECLLIRNHSAIGLVARLEERGLVRREVSAQDRRRVLVYLTPDAQMKLETISRGNLAELKQSATAITDLLRTIEHLEDRDERSVGPNPSGD